MNAAVTVNLPLSVLALPRAVVTDHKAPHLSERYNHFDSRAVVATLKDEGFEVAGCRAVRRRKGEDPLYAPHQIEFRRPADLTKNFGVGGDPMVPRWLFTNSHDGTTSVRLMGGVFRVICGNGMVAWDECWGKVAMRHSSASLTGLVSRLKEMAHGNQMQREIEEMRARTLSRKMQMEFARLSSIERWNTDRMFEPEKLLAPRREEDTGDNVWVVMNRVQENIIRGGITGINAGGRPALSRGVADFEKDTKINQRLWQLGLEFAKWAA